MPFMPDDNVSGNILGGETGQSDAILYETKDRRSEAERREAERSRNLQPKSAQPEEVDNDIYRTERV